MDFNFDLQPSQPKDLAACHLLIQELWSKCKTQHQEISDLKEKNNLNSTNSSLPPSSDLPKAIVKRTEEDDWRKRTPIYWKKPRQGAQDGHKGHGRKLLDSDLVDEVIRCEPASTCKACGNTVIIGKLCHRKQVFNIKTFAVHVTEYQIYGGRCSECRLAHKGSFPEGLRGGILGESILGLIGSMTGKYRLSKREAREMLEEFYGLKVSLGTVSNSEKTVAKALETPTEEVRHQIQKEEIVHSDETSHYRKHKLEWLWVATMPLLTYFQIFKNRNQESAKAILGENFPGMLIADRYGAYNWVSSKRRQHCWSHIKRDFKKVSDREDPKESDIGVYLLLYQQLMFRAWSKIRDGTATAYDKASIQSSIGKIKTYLEKGEALEKTKTAAFCKRLLKDWECLWHFLNHKGVDPTNNHAERQLRHAVLWRKKSFGTQSERGNQFVERMLTTIMTCRQQKRSSLKFIEESVKAYWEKKEYPSLLIKMKGGKI